MLSITLLVLLAIAVFFSCRKFWAEEKAARALQEKAHIEADNARMVGLRQMVYDGCAYAFEWAGKERKAGHTLTGDEKKAIAVGYVLRHFKADEALVADVVESCLGKCMDGASGKEKI